MTDTRATGQELQDQVLTAARKGRQRVTSTVKTVTATAQQIRPQLPKLPTVHIELPTPAELREKAPAFIAKLSHPDQLAGQLREKAPAFIAKLQHPDQLADELRERAAKFGKLPTPDQLRERAAKFGKLPTPHELRVSAEDFTGQVIAAQRHMISQLRSVTTPIAKQAAAVFAQASQAARGQAAPVVGPKGEAKEAEHVRPAEPVKHEPVKHEPVKHEPVRHVPVRHQEAATPAETKPAHAAPRRAAAPTRKSKARPATK